MKTKENRKNRGITLIALVITIIVLLILAGITIGAITSENGIIQNALSAKEQTEIANEREIVEEATVRAMGKNKRGNIVRDELQEELDKITGEGETIVTTDTEESGYFVKFVDSGRIYKVSIDGEVEYLGKEDELITQAEIIADPESNTTAELIQQVDLTVKTPIEIEGAEYSLVYAWNQDKENAPEDTKFLEANLIGEGRIRTTTVYSSDTVGGDYYLWVRIVVGDIEREACFGPYVIKDHTTLVATSEETESTSGFLGNSEVQRGLIESINIITSLSGHSVNDENTWDVSQSKNGMYLAWYEDSDNDGYYEVTIAGNGGVVANSYSTGLFKQIGCGVENQEVKITGLENLETGLVTNMSYMFDNCKATNLNVSKFNTENVTNMYGMFSNCKSSSLNLSSFNTSNVINMNLMFVNCSATTLDLSNFDTSKVTTMISMFSNCKSSSLNLSSFNTSNVIDMNNMFNNCSATVLDLSNFDTSKVTNMSLMFNNCKSSNLNLSSFNTSNVTNMYKMFFECTNLTSLNLSNFNTDNVKNMSNMFDGCTKIIELDISSFNSDSLTNLTYMFHRCSSLTNLNIGNFNIGSATSMEGMFRLCSSLKSLDLSNFNTSNVTSLYQVFSGCSSLQELNLSSFETTNITNMNLLFNGCRNLQKLNISKFEMTNVSNYSDIFNVVPTTCNIITNQSTKQWIVNNFPKYTNITVL